MVGTLITVIHWDRLVFERIQAMRASGTTPTSTEEKRLMRLIHPDKAGPRHPEHLQDYNYAQGRFFEYQQIRDIRLKEYHWRPFLENRRGERF